MIINLSRIHQKVWCKNLNSFVSEQVMRFETMARMELVNMVVLNIGLCDCD